MTIYPSQREFLQRLNDSNGERVVRVAKDVRLAQSLINEGYVKRKGGVHARGLLQAGDTVKITESGRLYLNSERWSKFCRP